MIIKNHLHPDRLNAVLIDGFDKDELVQHCNDILQGNSKFKLIVCNKLLEDVEDENKLNDLICKEHLSKNRRGIDAVHNELKLTICNPKLKLQLRKLCFRKI